MTEEIHVRTDEKDWHDELFRQRSNANLIVSDAIRRRYLSVRRRVYFGLEKMFQLTGDVQNKRILIVGCGDANTTVLMALKGAEVWATDISIEAAKIQQRMADLNGVRTQIHVVVSGAEELCFPRSFFDLVFGTAVLHHLPDHLDLVSSEIRRVIKSSGFVLFAEPVARSAFLLKIRRLFPAPDISPGERQLTDADLQTVTGAFKAEFFPYNLFSRLTYFIGNKPLEGASLARKAVVYGLSWLDSCLLRMGMFERFAGGLVIKMYPKRTPPVAN